MHNCKSMISLGEYHTKEAKFYFRSLTMNDLVEAQQLIISHYSTREQIRTALNVPHAELIAVDKQRTKSNLEHKNASVGAFECASGRLVGVQMNALLMRTADGMEQKDDEEMIKVDAKFPWRTPVKRLMKKLCDENLFKLYKTDRLVRVYMLTVHEDFSRLGLAKQLIIKSETLAKHFGYNLIVAKPTSAYSKSIFINLKYTLEFSLNVQEYVDDVTGENPFKTMTHPHNVLTLYHRRLLD
ncbi:uncharacterized protein LOC144747587 [Ciona intestinalis]